MAGSYPCDGCVVLPCCTTFCGKVSKKKTEAIKKSIDKSICPDCGGTKWRMYIDTTSYGSIFMCEGCNHRFNSYGGRYY
jgi:hypothetical protein